MKLGIVRQRYTPYGGAERFVERAIEALLARGIGIRVYTRRWPDALPPGVEAVLCDPFHVGSLWRDAGFARAVRAALARERPDLVQTHERIDGCDIFRAGDGLHRTWLAERRRAAGRLERARVAANPYHRYVLDAEARVFAHPALEAVICNSRMVRDDIRAQFGFPDERLHVVYNAVDPAEFGPHVRARRDATRAELGASAADVVFLLVGSGYGRKGVAVAIRALARLPGNARLVVVGRDRRAARYAALARRVGVAARIAFAGAQPDPRPYFGAADAFVLPTLYDPLPNAALEALACGLPVVTSTRCGAAELVRAHGAGRVCDALDVDAVAACMAGLLDGAAREEMGQRALAAVRDLTPDAMSAELVRLYQSLLARRRGSAA
jgi:UDP-glucose:(heptosyl)LPS alpha-1,3-glucosyltransferase